MLLAVVVLAVAGGSVVAFTELWDTAVPDDLAAPDVGDAPFDREAVRDGQAYEGPLRILRIASYAVLVLVLFVYARRGAVFARESAAGPIGTGFLLGMLGIAIVWLVRLPFSLFEVWWGRRHDAIEIDYLDWFSTETGTVMADALFLCLALLVVMGFARLMRTAWWIPASVAFAALALGFAFASPYLLPGLETPSAQIRADARRLSEQGLPRVPVRIEKVHEWTSDPNTFAMGLGSTRRVVLWDTLSEDFPRDEVRVVLAHELGHHEHDHIAKSVGWLALFVVPAGLIVALVTRRRGGLAEPAAVPLALFVVVVLNLLAMPLQNAASRRYESEADWTALTATREPKAMERLFKRFSEEFVSDPDPPGWWTAVFATHPTGAERVAMARAYARRAAAGGP